MVFSRPLRIACSTSANFGRSAIFSHDWRRNSRTGIVRHTVGSRELENVCLPALAFVGRRWLLWVFVDLHWPSLAVIGCCGPSWACVGCCGPSLTCIGLCWPSLAAVGFHGPVLAFGGRCWLLWAFFVNKMVEKIEKKKTHLGPKRCQMCHLGPFCLRGPALAFVGRHWLLWAFVDLRWLLWAFVDLRWPSLAVVGSRGLSWRCVGLLVAV